MSFPPLLVVLHETIATTKKVLRLHGDPEYLASYHTLIKRDGGIVYLVPSEHKAFAAGNSVFVNPVTNKEEAINGSVDDFAYHIALETPVDGMDRTKARHSGYTYEQYLSLAWLLRATGVSLERIVKHSDISQADETLESEPRCLNLEFLFKVLNKQPNQPSIDFGLVSVDPVSDNTDDSETVIQQSRPPKP